MRLPIISCLLLSLSCATIFAQPSIAWQQCYGGSGFDEVRDIKKTLDSGYIVATISASLDGDVIGNHGGNGDYWLLKLDSIGSIEWQKCLGGSQFEEPYSLSQISNGGFIVAGISASNDGDVSGNHSNSQDIWIVQLDAFGTIQWQKCYGGSNVDRPRKIYQTSDLGYIVIGETFSNDGDVTINHGDIDIWVFKTDSSGLLLWENSLGGSDTEHAADIQESSDGYVLVGSTLSTDGDVIGDSLGYSGCWLVKLDSFGNLIWQVPTGASDTASLAVSLQLKDNYYIVEGNNNFFPINRSGYSATKIDSLGNFTNWHSYGDWNYNRYSKSSIETSDNGFLITGLQRAYIGGDANYYVLKIDSNFNVQWEFSAGGAASDDYAIASCESDDGFLIAGFDGDGCTPVPMFPDCWFIKLSSASSNVADNISFLNDYTVYTIDNRLILEFFDNFNEHARLNLVDIAGRTLINQSIELRKGFNKHEIKLQLLSDGVYFVNLYTELGKTSKKLIVY